MQKLFHILFITLISFGCKNSKNTQSFAQTLNNNRPYEIENVISNLDNPWGMCWLPDGSMLISEKSGEIIHFNNGNKTLLNNVPKVYNRGQGGLLDIALHPNYKNNGWIYITYSSSDFNNEEGGNTVLARFKLEQNNVSNLQILYTASPNSTKGQHFGSRIAFDNENYIYFSIGDRGDRDQNPQDITKDGGKIYRLKDNGDIPQDNPFYNTPNAKKAIFTFGNRNPQGLVKNPFTGAIWAHEHGPKGGDEVNLIEKGKNYGWPVITYGENYNGTPITPTTQKEGMQQPIYYWTPSIAPCGMDFVFGNKFKQWEGNLLVGSLKFNYVEMLEIKNNKVIKSTKIAEDIGRVRNVKMGPDEFIYIAVEGQGIFRLVPKN